MRNATPADVQQLVTMMDEFYAEGGYRLNQAHAAEAFAGLLADERLGWVWLIQSNSEDVG